MTALDAAVHDFDLVLAAYKSPKTRKIYQEVARQILAASKDAPLKITSYGRYLQVKAVLKLLQQHNLRDDQPIPGYLAKYPNREGSPHSQTQAKVIAPENFQKILDALPPTPHGRELRTACIFGFHAGMRLGEILSLERKQISVDRRGEIAILIPAEKAKNHEEHVTYMPPEFVDLVRAFQGFAITAPYVESTFRRIVRGLFPDKRYTFHGLRHSFATRIREDVDIRDVQRMLGHKNITTTARIYDHPAPKMPKGLKRAWGLE